LGILADIFSFFPTDQCLVACPPSLSGIFNRVKDVSLLGKRVVCFMSEAGFSFSVGFVLSRSSLRRGCASSLFASPITPFYHVSSPCPLQRVRSLCSLLPFCRGSLAPFGLSPRRIDFFFPRRPSGCIPSWARGVFHFFFFGLTVSHSFRGKSLLPCFPFVCLGCRFIGAPLHCRRQ